MDESDGYDDENEGSSEGYEGYFLYVLGYFSDHALIEAYVGNGGIGFDDLSDGFDAVFVEVIGVEIEGVRIIERDWSVFEYGVVVGEGFLHVCGGVFFADEFKAFFFYENAVF